MRRIVRAISVFVVSGIVCASLGACDRIETAIIKRGAAETAEADRTDWLEDGALHLVLCGTGSPLPDAARAGPCAAVLAGGHFFLIDAGPGSWENVQLWRLPRAGLSGLLLTHFHSDHIGELGEVVLQSWVGGRTEPLTVYGPPGVDRVVDGFRQAYSFDTDYRVAHHGDQAMPRRAAATEASTVHISEGENSALVFDADGVRVTAFRVNHEPVVPAYGYRFEYAGRSVFITGDTAKSAGVVAGARDVDVLLSEVLVARFVSQASEFLAAAGQDRLARLSRDVLDYHVTPSQAVEMAAEAGAGLLVFTHIVPSPPNAIAATMFLRGLDKSWGGEVLMGSDGMHFRLPRDSDAIERTNLSD